MSIQSYHPIMREKRSNYAQRGPFLVHTFEEREATLRLISLIISGFEPRALTAGTAPRGVPSLLVVDQQDGQWCTQECIPGHIAGGVYPPWYTRLYTPRVASLPPLYTQGSLPTTVIPQGVYPTVYTSGCVPNGVYLRVSLLLCYTSQGVSPAVLYLPGCVSRCICTSGCVSRCICTSGCVASCWVIPQGV